MTLEDEKKIVIVNKSKSYLLPLLDKYIGVEFLYDIENTFINIDGHVECMAILYKRNITPQVVKYFNRLREHSLYRKEIILKNYVLFIFEFPEQFLKEYKYFHLGLYSKFSIDAKKIITRFISNNYQYPELIEDMVQILYKNKARKEKLEEQLGIKLSDDAELTSVIDEEEETFYIEKYENRGS